MDIPDETFDVVLDKAMLDSLLCGSQPVHDMRRALNEIERYPTYLPTNLLTRLPTYPPS